ncbi:MAG TPA: F0F1 ATP synthase subunit gamma [Actinomycetota bacterium]|jgi:F-type H+-transporting ATPase subunit gamma|nr:F0F1 ATP synthase subunit gamma [Actinomycetota bacterium]
MGAKLRTIRRRIRSVQSTMKITRAMELIAASRILKAQQRVEAARPYAEQLTRAMEDVARQTGALVHPLLEERPNPQKVAVLLVTSDRGLCGAYNANVIRRAERLIGRLRGDGVEPVLYVVGRKGVSYFRFRRIPVESSWTGFSEVPGYAQAEEIGEALIGAFAEGGVDAVHAAYTDFRSAFTLRPIDKRFLPIAPEEVSGEAAEPSAEYIFEPEPAEILDALLPRYVTAKIFHAMLESAASENAARRRAMKAATDNAEDLIRRLTRVANQARQAEITTELMEVVGGAEALRQIREMG